ncbi:interleukin-10 receptor subunit alpha [Melanotaenia boesemani]|uniref:interleukin-10 receptor subunit alpha n=1 Tax=Melanotaenia boesemani TaxID=1250792 RepID=UPI001C03FAA3|nr:interleukin-10 receptor subunit alpha [Melanotaenia boesemani]
MTSFQSLKKDMKSNMPILTFLILYINQVSGMQVPQPDKLEVNIIDGEVVALWKPPTDAPSNFSYNVQMTEYVGEWADVTHCTRITKNYCHLSSLIHNYGIAYKVRVQLVTRDDESTWTFKKFLPNDSDLLPPSFTLWATSSTLTVYVHEKPILKKLFPYGVTYTIYLDEMGQENKTTTAYLKDEVEDQRTKIFNGLHWGRKYCVSIKVEGNGALSTSSVSKQQCLLLPEQEWFIIATSSLSFLGVLAVVAIIASILLCYLKRPAKTPSSLKSPVSGWLPLSVAEGIVEVVTDKGWFLSSYGKEENNCVRLPVTHLTVTEDKEEEDRRTSMDSGVSMVSNSITTSGSSPPMRQEDSGFGSMGGPESSTSSQTNYPMKDEMTESEAVRKNEDSGMGMSCQLESSSMSLDGQDSVPLLESVTGGNYHSQSPAAVQKIHACDDEDIFKQIPTDSILAEVVTGYRAGPQSCICSGAGQCSWCHKFGLHENEVTKQYSGVCIENELLVSKRDLVDSYESTVTFSGYHSKTQLDTVMINDMDTRFLQISKAFPLLTSLPLVKCGQDFNMNNVSLCLCDVELATD